MAWDETLIATIYGETIVVQEPIRFPAVEALTLRAPRAPAEGVPVFAEMILRGRAFPVPEGPPPRVFRPPAADSPRLPPGSLLPRPDESPPGWRGHHHAAGRGKYRIFNAAVYEFWRSLDSPPDQDVDSPFATAASLPATPADTFGDGVWYLAVSYLDGVLRSPFLPLGRKGETYRILEIVDGVQLSTPPSGPSYEILTAAAAGVVRVIGQYFPWIDGDDRAEEWAIAYTVNGSTPPEDAPDVTVDMLDSSGLEVLDYSLPGQADGTTVKVRIQTRRNDGTVEVPVWVYSDDSAVLTITADAAGPSAPAAGVAWPGYLPEDL